MLNTRNPRSNGACAHAALVIIAMALGLAWATPAAASRRPVVVFTVDVESEGSLGLPAQVDAVCSDGGTCGLTEIVRLLAERDWPATFFLNVYEQARWGEPAMRGIAVRLQSSGHDVALHTHPHWAYDAARPGMREYTLEDQTSIIRDGVRSLEAWTKLPVVAHRAGAYAADERTLVALERNGVLVDSSVFWKHPSSRLDGLGLPRNFPGRYGRVLQIPVSAYERQDRPPVLGNLLAPVRSIRKIDPDWFVNAAEARAALDALVELDVPVIVVFLHSFSLMTHTGDGTAPTRDSHAVEMFRTILDYVAARQFPVTTMRQVAAQPIEVRTAAGEPEVPGVMVAVDLPHYGWRRAKSANKWALSAAAGLPLLSLGLASVFLVRRRSVARLDGRRHVIGHPGAGKGVHVQ